MPSVKIGIRGFTYYKEVDDPNDPDKTIRVSKFAGRGQVVEISEADFKRGQAIGAFADESGSAVADSDGDQEDVVLAEELSDDELVDYLTEESPNAADTIALAANDPEQARRVLDAEIDVTGGDPRKGVEEKLNAIIEG